MFSITSIKAAEKKINKEFKAYVTSDNSLYVIKRENSIDDLKKHCLENDLSLLDVERNHVIEFIKEKKIKK